MLNVIVKIMGIYIYAVIPVIVTITVRLYVALTVIVTIRWRSICSVNIYCDNYVEA